MIPAQKSLITVLEQSNLATKDFLIQFKNTPSDKLFNLLQHNQIFSEQHLHWALQKILKLTTSCIKNLQFDSKLSKKYHCNNHSFYPIFETSTHITLALSNPYLTIHLPQTSKTISTILISQQELNQLYNQTSPQSLEHILNQAIQQNSSDIHFFETTNHSALVYFRIHGHLTNYGQLSKNSYTQIKQFIKLEASLDLGIKSTPQDGHFQLNQHPTTYDIRVSTLPTTHGEDIVCRLFSNQTKYETLSDLGIPFKKRSLIESMCDHKAGLILVTGPTGSGKTTTLYTLLRHLQSKQRGIIISLEDPVEKQLSGIRQSSIQTQKGYTYANGLKAILRQDPDIIMVGEIRDKQTAEIAIEAAYTGHLVLSSLHTHDVMSTLYRFKHFCCDPFLLQYVLKGIIAQQLIPVKNNNIVTHRALKQELLYLNKSITTNIFEQHIPDKLGTFLE